MGTPRKKPIVFKARQAKGGHHDPEITLGMARAERNQPDVRFAHGRM